MRTMKVAVTGLGKSWSYSQEAGVDNSQYRDSWVQNVLEDLGLKSPRGLLFWMLVPGKGAIEV